MQEKNLDALIILGDAEHNPPMYYQTGGGHISAATLIQKVGQPPVLYCNDMEREEAARTGLEVVLYSKYSFHELVKKAHGDMTLFGALRLQLILNDHGLSEGRLGIYGVIDLGFGFGMLSHLQELMPGITLVGEASQDSVIFKAMETKDEAEVERIRKMGKVTTEVVGLVKDFLTSREVDGEENLLEEDGSLLTIGSVKARINLWLAERGVENPEGTIFAIGRDAGVPHSVGRPEDKVCLGKTIIFDIFPCEAGGGYFFDFTRTWCLGYAAPEAQALYDQVIGAYDLVLENMEANVPFKTYQKLVCDYFEECGHQTPITDEAPKEGYVHSLGHGVGINVHERPFSGIYTTDDHMIRPGVVVTLEPGLYYPDKGMGARVEDTFWVRPDGQMELLGSFPYDLVLDMKKWKK